MLQVKIVTCAVCGKPFQDEVYPDECDEEHYCSPSCHMQDSHEALDGTLDLIAAGMV